MKTICTSVAALTAACTTSTPHRPALTLVENGQARATIVIGANPSQQARDAAAELQTHLQKITGAQLPIAAEGESGAGILVGQAAAQEAAKQMGLTIPSGITPDCNEEGYVVAADEQALILAGNETAMYLGTAYAVYDFLESLGCRWYFPGEFGEVVPRAASITVPEMKRVCRPVFRLRDMWYAGYQHVTKQQEVEFNQWKTRNRYSPRGWYTHFPTPYIQHPADGTTDRLLPKDRFFASHPEYYGLKADGTRDPSFPCASNAAGIKAAAQVVGEYLEQHQAHTFGFSLPDALVTCHCPDCLKQNTDRSALGDWGMVSRQFFFYAKRLADEVNKPRPDALIGVQAYSNRFSPPQGVNEKWDNIYVQIAPMGSCEFHKYTKKAGCDISDLTGGVLDEWARIAQAVVFYDYDPLDWQKLHAPLWTSRAIQADYQWLAQHHGWGMTVESQMDFATTGLNAWIRGKLTWDVNVSVEALLADFCRNYFGPAGAAMTRYYRLVEDHLQHGDVHLVAGGGDLETQLAVWHEAILDQMDRALAKAERAASAEPWKSRVALFRAQCDRLRAASAAYQAACRGDYREAARQAERMKTIADGVDNPVFIVDETAPPEYRGRNSGQNLSKIFNQMADHLSGAKIIAVPQQARFRKDPGGRGILLRWYLPSPPVTGPEWRDISLRHGWDVHDVVEEDGSAYDGLAWYRFEVNIPPRTKPRIYFPHTNPELKGKHYELWVNGRYVGLFDNRTDDVDLSSVATPGKNVIAIRWDGGAYPPVRYAGITGGIAIPPVIYTK